MLALSLTRKFKFSEHNWVEISLTGRVDSNINGSMRKGQFNIIAGVLCVRWDDNQGLIPVSGNRDITVSIMDYLKGES